MKLPRRLARLAAIPMLLGVCAALISAAAPAASAAPLPSSPQNGWVRIAHLSPEAPAMDAYLYPFGDPAHPTVLKDVSYGDVSAYMALAPGQYTLAMRGFGAPASSHPALVSSFMVGPKTAYTVAALGPDPGLRVEVLQDQLTAPKGQALVRVVEGSVKDAHVTVSYGATVLANQLAFGSATPYAAVAAGVRSVKITASGDAPATTTSLQLTANSVHTIVVLDGSSGLTTDVLTDAVGSQLMPAGGAATGFGGTALRPSADLLPWLALTLAGGLLIAVGVAGFGWPRRRAVLLRAVAGVGQHPAQVGDHLDVDVLALGGIEVFQLVP